VGQRQEGDHAAAGLFLWQRRRQPSPSPCSDPRGVGGAGEELVAVDGAGERLRLAPERLDDMAIIDDVEAAAVFAPTLARVAEHASCAEPCLDTIIVEVNPQSPVGQWGPINRAGAL